jgi:hypothetical protein
MAGKKWMQNVHPKKGALTQQMKRTPGLKKFVSKEGGIASKGLTAAQKKGGLLKKRATLAKTYRASER